MLMTLGKIVASAIAILVIAALAVTIQPRPEPRSIQLPSTQLMVNRINPEAPIVSVAKTVELSSSELNELPALKAGIEEVQNRWSFKLPYSSMQMIDLLQVNSLLSALPFTDTSRLYSGGDAQTVIVKYDGHLYMVVLFGTYAKILSWLH